MPIILAIITAIAAGFIASKLMKVQLSILETIAVGLLGVVAAAVFSRILIAISGVGFTLVLAVAGAVLVIWLYLKWRGKSIGKDE
ncbi:MAG: GlsB/YeaQ/YmgE family stress response membrane protein [Pikeienuella sp.]